MKTRIAIPITLAVLSLAAGARAQRHEDNRHGIAFKPPKDFVSVALKPSEFITIAKYQAEQKEYGGDQGFVSLNRSFRIEYWPADFGLSALFDDEDSQGEPDPEPEADPDDEFQRFDKKLEAELTELDPIEAGWKRIETRFGLHDVVKSKKIKIDKQNCEERHILPLDADGAPRQINANGYPATLMYWVALVAEDDGVFAFIGNGFDKNFDKAAREYASSTKSFKRIEKDGSLTSLAANITSQLGDQEKFLQEQIDRLQPGWSHLRTDRYLFLYNAEKGFVEEMAKQVESIRDVYEQLYPPSEPIEAVSIVRVCNSFEEYQGYGGPPGSGGYWSTRDKELVFFDFRPRTLTLAVLNHEAFHQYIYYYYGELSPHSWYNEGHGDYFAGADMTSSKRIKGFGDAPGGVARMMTAKEACRLRAAGKFDDEMSATPLRELMRFSQQEYYANGGKHYAQGWALVHMLREAKGLKAQWQRILPDYLQNLLAAREEVARKEMKNYLDNKEKEEKGSSEGLSTDPKDYYAMAPVSKIQDLAYDKTFGDWTDADWDDFDAFYVRYVEKL